MATTFGTAQPSGDDEMLVERILTAVATKEQCDVLDLSPLYEAVDPEGLRRVVDGVGVAEVSFRYHGYTVVVDGHDSVRVSSEQE